MENKTIWSPLTKEEEYMSLAGITMESKTNSTKEGGSFKDTFARPSKII
jgi:hypothetical protein